MRQWYVLLGRVILTGCGTTRGLDVELFGGPLADMPIPPWAGMGLSSVGRPPDDIPCGYMWALGGGTLIGRFSGPEKQQKVWFC